MAMNTIICSTHLVAVQKLLVLLLLSPTTVDADDDAFLQLRSLYAAVTGR